MGRANHILLAITGAFDLEGGIANANRLAIYALSQAGWCLSILALNEPPKRSQDYHGFSNIHYQGFGNNKVAFTAHVWRIILQRRTRLVFFDHVNLASIVYPMSAVRLIRVVIRLNGIEVFDPLPSIEGKIGLMGATQLLAISDYTRLRVLRNYSALSITACDLSLQPNVKIVNNVKVVPLEFVSVDGISRSLGNEVILHVGRMASSERYKGHDTLIRAMSYVLEKHPQAQLVFVGRGDDRDRLIGLVRAQNARIQRAIFFTGFLEQETLEALYAGCYVFAMPSHGEGFGLVYIEAMRYGKPCIGSSVDAASTIIMHEQTGFLVNDPSNPIECANYVSKLLSSQELAQQTGNAGRQRVADYYLFEHFQARFLSALGLS